MKVPFKEFAVQKVRRFVPPIYEKALLLVLAEHAKPWGIIEPLSMSTLASDLGRSVRTTRRWIRELENHALLQTDFGGVLPGVASSYFLPFCCWTNDQLEELTIRSGGRLELPFSRTPVDRETAILVYKEVLGFSGQPRTEKQVSVVQPRTSCPPTPDKMTGDPGQDDRPTLHGGNKGPGSRGTLLEELGVKLKKPKQYGVSYEKPIIPVLTRDPLEYLRETVPELATEIERERQALLWHGDVNPPGAVLVEPLPGI